MSTGSLDNGGIREVYDEVLDMVPNDANIFEGCVVVFDSTSGDNKTIVLPNHANALLAGRAFAGISYDVGSPSLSTTPPQDRFWKVQRDGIAKCALKNSTACTRGGIAAYDPNDGGYVVPYTSAKQLPIGRFQQTLSSGTSQMVGVKIGHIGGASTDLVGAIITTSTAVGADAETLLDQTVTLAANEISVGDVVHITGKCRATVGADTETLVLKVYWGGLAGLALAASTATDVAANDIYVFDIWCTVRSATTIDLFGTHNPVPAAPDTAAPKNLGAAGVQTIPTITAAAVIGVSSNWSAASDDRVVLESLIVMHHRASV